MNSTTPREIPILEQGLEGAAGGSQPVWVLIDCVASRAAIRSLVAVLWEGIGVLLFLLL